MVSSSASGYLRSSARTSISRPGEQKPHCSAPSSAMQRANSSRAAPTPSSVVTLWPSTRAMRTEQESTGSSSIHTVHRPQELVSQPHLTDLSACSRQ